MPITRQTTVSHPFVYVMTPLDRVVPSTAGRWYVEVHPAGIVPRTSETILEARTFDSYFQADSYRYEGGK